MNITTMILYNRRYPWCVVSYRILTRHFRTDDFIKTRHFRTDDFIKTRNFRTGERREEDFSSPWTPDWSALGLSLYRILSYFIKTRRFIRARHFKNRRKNQDRGTIRTKLDFHYRLGILSFYHILSRK